MDIEEFGLKKQLKILAIDDDETIIKLYLNILEDLGHKIIIAKTGEDAAKKVKEEKFSLILLDLVLPDTHGNELLKKIKGSIADTPVVIITGNPSMESSIEAIRAGGVYDYIVKPFRPADLKMVILRALEKVELTRENKRLVNRLQATNKALIERVSELEHFAKEEVKYTQQIQDLQSQIEKLEKKKTGSKKKKKD